MDNGWGVFWMVSLPFIEQAIPPSTGGGLSLTDTLENGQTVGEALNQLLTIKNTTTAVLGLSV